MSPPREHRVSERILILAPTGRDATLAAMALGNVGIDSEVCADIDALCEAIDVGCGAVMITEEALSAAAMKCLDEVLAKQPKWGDLPLLIFTSSPSAELTVKSFEALGPRANVTLIERPIRVKTLISAARAALRARKRQYEVRDLLGELEQRIDERDQFLAMLSHELRNPLAAIMLATEGFEAKGDGRNAERDILVRQTRHLKKLVDDLLDIGRVTSGKIVLHRALVDLVDIVEHCIETMRGRIDARRLTVRSEHRVEHAYVNGDAVRLEQVVNNLVSNAIKYTPPGGSIFVTIEKENGEAVLRVRDDGKGIAQEMLTRIFDLFMQGDVTIDRAEGGMGIGLTLVRKLTELHGGTVRAYSRGKGSGSEFVVRLPLAVEMPQTDAKRADKTAVKSPPRHIIVVEDNPDVRDLLRLKLRQLGHKVDVAEDGVKGCELIVKARPQVALVDIGLPGMNGYEIAKRVRDEAGSEIYLVALTGYGQAEDREHAIAAGFDVHLTKPADMVDLQNVLGNIPARNSGGRQAASGEQ